MALEAIDKWFISLQAGLVLYAMMALFGECRDIKLAILYVLVVRWMMR